MFPDGYAPLSRRLPQGQPWQSSNEKIAAHWSQRARDEAGRFKAMGDEANGSIPSLNDVYAVSTAEAKQRTEQHLAEVEASPYSFVNRMPSTMLPKSDPINVELKNRHFGLPTHEAEMARLQAERDALQQGLDRLANAIMGS